MSYLLLGLALFAVPHFISILLPSMPLGMKARMGENAFKGIYALLCFIGIGLMVYGYSQAWATATGIEPLYDPPAWGRHVAMLLILAGFILIGASHGKGYMRLWVRNPMSIGVSLWAAGHLLANGLRYEAWLFGTFLMIGVLDILLSTIRGKVPNHAPAARSDLMAVIVGVVLYAVFAFVFHPYILGVPVTK